MAGDARIKIFIEEEAKPAVRNKLPELEKRIEDLEKAPDIEERVKALVAAMLKRSRKK